MKTPYLILLIIGVAGLFAVVGWLAWSLIRPYGSIKTWPEIASRLGLTHTPFPASTAMHPGSMAGAYNGFEVSISARERYRRGAQMVIEVRFPQPLGVGLHMGTSPGVRSGAEPGSAEAKSEDARFDQAFDPCATDIPGARRMLSNDAVRDGLWQLVGAGGEVGADDEKLIYVHEQLMTDFASVKNLLELAVATARAIEEARH